MREWLRRSAVFVLCASFGLLGAGLVDDTFPPSSVTHVVFPFAVGAVLYVLYAPPLTRRVSGRVDGAVSQFIFGGTFVLWGSALGLACGGFFGVWHAVITTIQLARWCRNLWMLPAPVLCLFPAWLVAEPVNRLAGSGLPPTTLWASCAVVTWNLCMLLWFVTVAQFAKPKVLPPDACRHCGYSLIGLPAGGLCPECGRETAGG